ncbi:Hypothetical predicted protein [Prunus dulcis]|uniref:Uncharacterized protein n=1 Tax=Prunus dulcis TaxID=3755 RepID=A0A5E4F572_PRUDU|nr:Hypothetical predicted protein [Prunus dulcis]
MFFVLASRTRATLDDRNKCSSRHLLAEPARLTFFYTLEWSNGAASSASKCRLEHRTGSNGPACSGHQEPLQPRR